MYTCTSRPPPPISLKDAFQKNVLFLIALDSEPGKNYYCPMAEHAWLTISAQLQPYPSQWSSAKT